MDLGKLNLLMVFDFSLKHTTAPAASKNDASGQNQLKNNQLASII